MDQTQWNSQLLQNIVITVMSTLFQVCGPGSNKFSKGTMNYATSWPCVKICWKKREHSLKPRVLTLRWEKSWQTLRNWKVFQNPYQKKFLTRPWLLFAVKFDLVNFHRPPVNVTVRLHVPCKCYCPAPCHHDKKSMMFFSISVVPKPNAI